MKGTITLPPNKSFAFIIPEGHTDGQPNVFFHESEVVGTTFAQLREGDMVTFEIKETEKDGVVKTSAVNVQKVTTTEPTPAPAA